MMYSFMYLYNLVQSDRLLRLTNSIACDQADVMKGFIKKFISNDSNIWIKHTADDIYHDSLIKWREVSLLKNDDLGFKLSYEDKQHRLQELRASKLDDVFARDIVETYSPERLSQNLTETIKNYIRDLFKKQYPNDLGDIEVMAHEDTEKKSYAISLDVINQEMRDTLTPLEYSAFKNSADGNYPKKRLADGSICKIGAQHHDALARARKKLAKNKFLVNRLRGL